MTPITAPQPSSATRLTPPAPRVPLDRVRAVLLKLHDEIRDAVVAACEAQSAEQLSAIAADDEGDTIYAVDKVSEDLLVEVLGRELATAEQPLVLVAEGIEGGSVVLPEGADPADAAWRVIVDPIDGTRGIMFQKRAAWILTGVAPNFGDGTTLRDIRLALMTEIPVVKQHLCDQLWVQDDVAADGGIAGEGTVQAERLNRLDGTRTPITLNASRADTVAHGFFSFARFFPGVKDVITEVDEAVTERLVGRPQPGKALCFEDQYMCTGGQLYELAAGRDRAVADLRPLVGPSLAERGLPMGLCCHPYDLCTMLVAERLGVVLAGPAGEPLDAPLDVDADVSWVGYANRALADRVTPVLREVLDERGLLPERDQRKGGAA